MRTESATSAKRGKWTATNNYPREGTRLRALYDLLAENKGLPVRVSPTVVAGPSGIARLTDFYGLDIRRVPGSCAGGGRKQPGLYVLAGEWFGPTYVDYIADRIAKADREAV